MKIKTLILFLTTLIMVGNANADDWAPGINLKSPMLCIAKYFTEHKFDLDDDKVLSVKSGKDDTKYLVSITGGVTQFGSDSYIHRSCKMINTLTLKCAEFNSSVISVRSESFVVDWYTGTFWFTTVPDTAKYTYYQIISGTCAQLPSTESKEGS